MKRSMAAVVEYPLGLRSLASSAVGLGEDEVRQHLSSATAPRHSASLYRYAFYLIILLWFGTLPRAACPFSVGIS